MKDFWLEYGSAYMVFSKFCSYKDWQNILYKIANEISEINNTSSNMILDVGAGQGRNTLDLLNILFNQSKVRYTLDVVEPSKDAQSVINKLIYSKNDGGYLNNMFNKLPEIEDRSYDSIIFMHSSYYIDNFYEMLLELYSNNLNDNGKIILLALPEHSPFFLSFDKITLKNNSSQVCYHLSKAGIKYLKHKMKSRLFLNHDFLLSEKEYEHLYNFITRGLIEKELFKTEFKNIVDMGSIDLQDEIIVVDKI